MTIKETIRVLVTLQDMYGDELEIIDVVHPECYPSYAIRDIEPQLVIDPETHELAVRFGF